MYRVGRGLADRVERALSAPELAARSYEGMLAVAQRVQVAVGAIGLVAIWWVPDVAPRDKLTVTALLLCVYLPWTIVGQKTSKAQGAVARVANLVMDLLAIGSFALLIPATRVAVMTAYVLMVSFHAYVSGRAGGVLVTSGVLAVGAAAELLAPPSERFDGFTVVMYAAVLFALTLLVDGLASERRSLIRHLSRLNDALQGVSPDPDLRGTLESVSAGARDAVSAGFVVVLLNKDDECPSAVVGSPPETVETGAEDVDDAMTAIKEHPETTPSGLAMLSGEQVTVADIRTDARFSRWTAMADAAGFRAMVAVPLGSPGAPLGTLNAYWPEPNAFDDSDVVLLAAYARQAGLAVGRAVAFTREQAAATQLADTDRIKSEFVARVSHELRTPLTAISGFISTVLLHWDHLDDPSKKDLLERASRNSAELRRMVEQVLAFARSGEVGGRLTVVECQLSSELESLVDHLAPVVGDHHIDLDVHPSVVVRVDREALQHVVTNLLANAAKFSPAGSPITVGARRTNGGTTVEVSVRDRGPGIAVDEQELIFDRFYRGSAVSAKGTGIGLSIVRTFVEQMGGRVTVSSELGEGATFTFTLPAVQDSTTDFHVPGEPAVVHR